MPYKGSGAHGAILSNKQGLERACSVTELHSGPIITLNYIESGCHEVTGRLPRLQFIEIAVFIRAGRGRDL